MYVSDFLDETWPTEDRYKRGRTEAEIAAALHRSAPVESSDEQEATPGRGRHNLRSGKQPLREAPEAKKKRKAATSPRQGGRINIRDSPPRKRRAYIGRAESDDAGNEDSEDGETLAARIARTATAAPPPPDGEGTSSAKSAERRGSPGRQARGPVGQTGDEVPEPGTDVDGEGQSGGEGDPGSRPSASRF